MPSPAQLVRDALCLAMLQNKVVQFNYPDQAGEMVQRRAEPYGIKPTQKSGREILTTWDLDRNDTRTFDIEKITDVSLGEKFHPRFPTMTIPL